MSMVKKIGLTASLLLASGFANAAVYNLVEENNVTPGIIGVFSDIFNFTLAPNASGYVLVSTDLNTGTPFSSIELFSGFNGGAAGTGTAGDTGDVFFLGLSMGKLDLPTSIMAGDYSFVVTGNSFGLESTYSISSTFDAVAITSPIPEPSSIALMLGGLGLVGFMAARRKKA